MKGKIKYLLFLLVGIMLLFTTEVKANTYSESFNDVYMWIPNAFFVKTSPNGEEDYFQLSMITRKSDNQFVYCMEINAALYPTVTYDGYDYDQNIKSNITLDEWHRIQLLAYYGYGYSDNNINHTDLKWYAVTQYMIWQTVPHGYTIGFTNTLAGTKLQSKYDEEIAEMESLINGHYVVPDFGATNFELTIGQNLKITDKNSVLSNYEITGDDFIGVTKNENELTLNGKNIGSTTLRLTKKDAKFSHPTIVYIKDGSQEVVEVGSYDPVNSFVNVIINGGKVSIHKKDYDTGLSKPQGEATLKGAVYGIYKEDGTFISQIITDENGYAESGYLPSLGRYYIQEITPSVGYELDSQKYYFDLSTSNLNVDIQVKEKVIERQYSITKVAGSNKTQIMTPEANIQFGIYDKDNNLIKTLTTDNEGRITFTLPYGKYTLRQLTVPSGYEKLKDYEFEITESGPTINKVFSNAEMNARVKVVKKDQDGNDIAKAGIRFKIKDLSTGKYVCQTVSYPTQKTYCEFETDEKGILITPYPLPSGDYQLEEVDQFIEGYLWNSKPLKFSINEKANIQSTEDFNAIIELIFSNTEVKGKIEVKKIGEKAVIKDGSYIYEEIPLPNVTFGLYDENGELINTYTTNKDGYILIENLKLGKYTLKELKTLNGFIIDERTYDIELKYQDQYTPIVTESFTLKNYLEKGKLEFTKKDLATGKEIPGVLIEIYTEDDKLIYSAITDENGKVIVDNLFIGKFYIIEKEPITGYKLNNEKAYFEIKENGEIVKATITNEKITGSLEFTKEDLSTGKPLPNALIEIYNVETDELIFSGRTDENGKIIIKNLEYGKYYILEKEAPEGYILNNEKMYFEILEDNEVVKANMVNEKIIGGLEFTKVDLSTGKPIPNTVIEIYDANTDELIYSGKTDEDGKIIVKKLEYGKYYILEKEAPKGYILNNEKMYFEIKANGEIVKATMTNEKEEMPNTNNTDLINILVCSGSLLIGMGLLLYDKKK